MCINNIMKFESRYTVSNKFHIIVCVISNMIYFYFASYINLLICFEISLLNKSLMQNLNTRTIFRVLHTNVIEIKFNDSRTIHTGHLTYVNLFNQSCSNIAKFIKDANFFFTNIKT